LRRRFYDDRGQPAGAQLEYGGGEIFEVQYKRLTGTTPIVYETFIHLEGEPTRRRNLSGSTSYRPSTHRHSRR